MREDSLELLRKHLQDAGEEFEKLPQSSKNLVIQVRDCYAMQIEDPWIGSTYVRDRLVETYGISKSQAYNVMALTSVLLGDVTTSHKNWIKLKAEKLMEEANAAANARDFALAAEKRKLAKTLGYLFRLDRDEGEILDIQKYLTKENCQITFNPNDIGVKYTAKDKELADKYFKKFAEDAEYEEVNDEESLPS